MKKLVVLMDNRNSPLSHLETEHGLSFYMEADGDRWLIDVGASDRFIRNAEPLGLDMADVDHLILSHAHADHTGGLEAFLSVNNKADIYLSSHISGQHYYSTRRGFRKDISIDYELLKGCASRLRSISVNTELSPSVKLLAEIPLRYATPSGNEGLLAGEERDDFSHEMAVQLRTQTGTYIISSCSHRGVLNTLEAAAEKKVAAYVGGMHLLDSDAGHRYETSGDLLAMAGEIAKKYPGIKIYTGHCSGDRAIQTLSAFFKDDFQTFYSGCRIL